MIQAAIILILAMAAVIGVACIFNATVRVAIARFIGGTFWNIAAFVPTWQQIGSAFATAGIVVLIILGVSLAAYALFGVLFFAASTAFGYAIGWGKTGIAFGLLFPLWFFLFTLPRIFNRLPIMGKITQFTRWLTAPTVAILFGLLVYGTIFPNLSQSSARGWKNMEQGWANLVDKKSAQSEAEAGIQGFAAEDNVAVYTNKNGTEIKKLLKRGDGFRVFNLDGKPADENAIGLLPIVLPNEFGDAIGKNRGWIASKNIIWRYEKEPAGVRPANYNPAPALAPAAQIAAEAPAETKVEEISFSGTWVFDWGNGPSEFAIRPSGTGFYGEGIYPDGSKMVMTIDRTGPTTFNGKWKIIGRPAQKYEGSYDVALDRDLGTGTWIHNAGNGSDLTIQKKV